MNAFGPDLLGPKVRQLYPTETLFGDWHGEVFLLAQDPMPASSLRRLISQCRNDGIPVGRAWRHADRHLYGDKKGVKTNENLKILAEKYIGHSAILYGSATAHMLYDDGVGDTYSQSLVGFYSEELQQHLQKVLSWVVSNMPNLKYIVCLGQKAWDLSVATSGKCSSSNQDFKSLRDSGGSVKIEISGRALNLIPTYHPAARVSVDRIERNWSRLLDER